jgi:Uma2 family endonuclease
VPGDATLVGVQELAPIAPERLRRLSRAEYDRMVALGMFDQERVELLYGMLVSMGPQGTRHAEVTSTLLEKLLRRLGDRARVRAHSPLALGGDSEPEPDVAVVPLGDYARAHPTTAHLVIEVADSSRDTDRRVKAPLYAGAGIPEYWLVDLVDDAVEVFRQPGPDGYRQVTRHGRGDMIAPEAFPDVQVAVADLLPAR